MDVDKPRKRSKKTKALKRSLSDEVHDDIDMDIDDVGGGDMTFEDLWHGAVPASEFDQDEDVEDMIEEMEKTAAEEDLEDSESDSSGSEVSDFD
jgi:hypothetical protein